MEFQSIMSLNPYHYLYSQLYLMNCKKRGKFCDFNFLTNLQLSIILLINFSTLVYISEVTTSINAINLILNLSKFQFLFILLTYFIFQLAYFSYNKKYIRILEKFDVEKRIENPNTYNFGALYALLSFAIYCIVISVSFNIK